MRLPPLAQLATLPSLALSAAVSSPFPGLVEWDAYSIKVRGERLPLLCGEFHPFRLPSPSLYLDIFQKIKAMGFTCVSFYVDWALLEGTPGTITIPPDSVFSLDPFFAAAAEAGIYLLARPGPFINAETSGGGFPGWVQRIKGLLRTDAADFINATRLYSQAIGRIIAAQQITHDGPVILFQPENEFSAALGDAAFPNATNAAYMAHVESLFRSAGMDVPMVNNDNFDGGSFRPGTGVGEVDIYGIDAYPMRYDCAHPSLWPDTRFYQTMTWRESHAEWSPNTPFSIIEFQGGSPDPWGGVGQDLCAELVGAEAERVVYKQLYSIGTKMLNLYMMFGGTNWGNLGHPGGYTSYDYGAAVKEDRTVGRRKYSELKLQGHWMRAVGEAYLTARPGTAGNGSWGVPGEMSVTPLWGTEYKTNFFVVRHADFRNTSSIRYKLELTTSLGNKTVPVLGRDSMLTLNGRDAKVHVTDMTVGNVSLLYTTAEVFAMASNGGDNGQVLLLYAGPNELHESALPADLGTPEIVGSGIITDTDAIPGYRVIQWTSSPLRRMLRFGNTLTIYLLDRTEAYSMWPIELPVAAPIGNYSSLSKDLVIVKAGYLMRTASLSGSSLYLTGDITGTTPIELLAAPHAVSKIFFNNEELSLSKTAFDTLSATVSFHPPPLHLPVLSSLSWRYTPSLPELDPSYDDSSWTSCVLNHTYNSLRPISTPTSLYAADYCFHAGSLLYRGHFTSTGDESTFTITTQGGLAFAHAVWLNDTLLGYWAGSPANDSYTQSFPLPASLEEGQAYVLTVLLDHMGLDENNAAGYDQTKSPRGILSYSLNDHDAADVQWKMTGNLGGEDYPDKSRGPLNEGAVYAVRQGWHQPGAPTGAWEWEMRSPTEGVPEGHGVGFFVAEFELGVEGGWDVPMAIAFGNDTSSSSSSSSSSSGVQGGRYDYRVVLYVNGYHFGKMVANLGPQTSFVVPEGVLDYGGRNTIALEVWDLSGRGRGLDGLELEVRKVVKSALGRARTVVMPRWGEREGAY